MDLYHFKQLIFSRNGGRNDFNRTGCPARAGDNETEKPGTSIDNEMLLAHRQNGRGSSVPG